GSTALLVIVMPLPAENRVRLLGFMQLISLAICLDRPITTAVVHEPVTNDDTDSSELTSLISGPPGSTPHAASEASEASEASAPSATAAATGARRCRVCNFLVAVGAAESNNGRKSRAVIMVGRPRASRTPGGRLAFWATVRRHAPSVLWLWLAADRRRDRRAAAGRRHHRDPAP